MNDPGGKAGEPVARIAPPPNENHADAAASGVASGKIRQHSRFRFRGPDQAVRPYSHFTKIVRTWFAPGANTRLHIQQVLSRSLAK
jgi:hypothetical protein